MGTPRRMAFVAALVSSALLFASCAPAGSTAPAAGRGGGDTSTISFQLYQKPNNLDPIHAVHGADQAASAVQFLRLLTYVDGEYVARVAKSWETTDFQHYTFVLNDMKWSDGSQLTADDVVYTFETYLHPEVASNWGSYVSAIEGAKDVQQGKTEKLSGVKVVDPTTLEVTLSTPDPNFLAFLTEIGIVPKAVYGEIEPAKLKGAPEFREPTVGSGSYLFSKWINDDTIEYVKNPDAFYPAQADRLILKYLTGDVAAAQLQTGEVDIAEVASTDVDSLAGQGVTIVSAPGNKVMALHNSVPSGKLADKRVKHAIMHAIDRQAIIDSVLAGKGRIAHSMLFQPDWAQHPEQDEYAYDPDKAKALLAEAGWDADTELYLDIVPGQADRDAVFRILVGQLQAVGFKAVIRNHQSADLNGYIDDFSLDLLISPYTQTVPEPSALGARLSCEAVWPAGSDITGYCNPELDKLMAQGKQTVDEAERAPIYQQVTKILNDELPQIPLYVADLNFGTTSTIKGFNARVWPVTAIADQWSK